MKTALALDGLIARGRNDGLAARHRLPSGRIIRGDACRKLFDGALTGVSSAAVWYDYETVGSERLTLAFAEAAAKHGAVLANYVEAEDVFDLEAASEPQVSPDGRRVVYVRGFADIKTDKRYSSLWIVDSAGSNHRALTSGNFTDQAPRWSPDGTRIAFVSDRDGSPQIHVL